MTVKKLIKLLQEEDPNRIVILQKDGEGNGYSPLSDFMTGSYVPDSTWSGEIYLEELTSELIKQGYGEEDVRTDGKKALVLCPVN